jgi:hypothetical protein
VDRIKRGMVQSKRLPLKIRAPIAQLVEQIPLKDKVPGSSPGGGTILIFYLNVLEFKTVKKE